LAGYQFGARVPGVVSVYLGGRRMVSPVIAP